MTKAEIASRLKNDPDFFVSMICQNNPQKVRENLIQAGCNSTIEPEELFNNIKVLAARDQNAAKAVLSVPIIPENLPEGWDEVINDLHL